jgi:hemerythrin
MKWSNEYAIGIERIDEHHKMLFKMAEDFRDALEEGRGERVYAELLHSLGVFVKSHFAFEETCMERYSCPVAQKNMEAHRRFSEVISWFQQEYKLRGFVEEDAHHIVDTIDWWLADHICTVDIQLKQYAQGE